MKFIKSYQYLQDLLQDLDLNISKNELVPPSTSVVYLGIMINAVNKTIYIPKDKFKELCMAYIKLSKQLPVVNRTSSPLLYITQ